MNRLGLNHFFRGMTIAVWLAGSGHFAAGADSAPDFREVYDLVKSNLTGVDQQMLNRAAVDGLLQQLKPQVALLPRDPVPPPEPVGGQGGLLKATVFDNAFGYFRVGLVDGGAAAALRQAYEKMAATNRLKGLLLDLRNAGGQDYGAALAGADCFFAEEQPLIDWGQGMKKSSAKSDAIRLPVMVLLNGRTAAAAEAVAGILRQSELALLIGATTAGRASQFKEFPLKNGDRLLVATSPVRLGDGKALPLSGLNPDIRVDVSTEDELAYWQDPYALPTRGGRGGAAAVASTNEPAGAATNRAGRRLTEADLVRMHREGRDPDLEGASARGAPVARPMLQDPVLVRALDVLKGLAVVRPGRPPGN